MKTKQIVNGHHTRKTADFVRACAAYCFITIPGMVAVRARLDLYLLSAKVALHNQCLGQGWFETLSPVKFCLQLFQLTLVSRLP